MPSASCLILLCGLFPTLLCAASSLPRLSLESLIQQSDTIVEGRVVRKWAAMDSENKFIWTHYEIKVNSTLKGNAQPSVEIGEPGGILNGRSLLVPGGTPYTVGEEVSVFLYRTPIGYLRTTNYGQGKFIVSADARVHANHSIDVGGAVIAAGTAAPLTGTNADSLDGTSRGDFESRIAHIVAAQQGRRQ
jgi:hypothetical protein